jgi:hypothetical protein
MICKNCGAKIINRESYCPSCGMELLIPYSKSLKEKYMAGEYIDRQDSSILNDKNRKTQDEYPSDSTREYEQYYENESQESNEPEESSSSGFLATFLVLIIALLIGFLIGMIIFSGTLQSLPGMGNFTGI